MAIMNSGEEAVSSDNELENESQVAIEVAHQRPPMKACPGVGMPEKMGELIAALHFFAVAKAISVLKSGKDCQ